MIVNKILKRTLLFGALLLYGGSSKNASIMESKFMDSGLGTMVFDSSVRNERKRYKQRCMLYFEASAKENKPWKVKTSMLMITA